MVQERERSEHDQSQAPASSLIDRIKAVSWEQSAQPEWNRAQTVADALCAVHQVTDAATSEAAYHDMLYAVGNNHAGTYYPVLLVAMPFLREIMETSGGWPQGTVLNVLVDLFASFVPESGYEYDAEGASIETQFRQSVHRLRPVLERIAAEASANSKIALELIDLLHESELGAAASHPRPLVVPEKGRAPGEVAPRFTVAAKRLSRLYYGISGIAGCAVAVVFYLYGGLLYAACIGVGSLALLLWVAFAPRATAAD